MQGQQVKVNYENITNSLPVILQEYFRMQGVQHLNLTIKGEQWHIVYWWIKTS